MTTQEQARATDSALVSESLAMLAALHKCLDQMLAGHALALSNPEQAWRMIHKAEDTARKAIACATGQV